MFIIYLRKIIDRLISTKLWVTMTVLIISRDAFYKKIATFEEFKAIAIMVILVFSGTTILEKWVNKPFNYQKYWQNKKYNNKT